MYKQDYPNMCTYIRSKYTMEYIKPRTPIWPPTVWLAHRKPHQNNPRNHSFCPCSLDENPGETPSRDDPHAHAYNIDNTVGYSGSGVGGGGCCCC